MTTAGAAAAFNLIRNIQRERLRRTTGYAAAPDLAGVLICLSCGELIHELFSERHRPPLGPCDARDLELQPFNPGDGLPR